MRWLRRGNVPAELRRPFIWLGALGLAVTLAGCATSSAGETAASRAQAQGERTEIEDDGLPVQVAPSSAVRQAPDDPSEPFSPGYGQKPPARLAGPPTSMSRGEEEALIARAIVEHEMRRP